MTIDDIEERAAIVAEGNGWSQRKAERVVAYWHNCAGWASLVDKVKGGKE